MRQRALLPHGVGEHGLAGVGGGVVAISGREKDDGGGMGIRAAFERRTRGIIERRCLRIVYFNVDRCFFFIK